MASRNIFIAYTFIVVRNGEKVVSGNGHTSATINYLITNPDALIGILKKGWNDKEYSAEEVTFFPQGWQFFE